MQAPPPHPPLRSPSPTTHPPIAQTPGPLATRLSEVYHNALQHTLRTCSYPAFAACFPTPAARKPELLRSVWSQVVGKLEERGVAEFEAIVRERDVVGGLNGLEAVLEAARRRKKEEEEGVEGGAGVVLHTLPPEQLYLAHLAPYLQSVESELREKLEGTRRRNEELVDGIRQMRGEVERLVGGLEDVVRDLEEANEVLEDGSLRGEVREIEGEVAAVKAGREARL